MGRRCVVLHCQNSKTNYKQRVTCRVHLFPKNDAIRRLWMTAAVPYDFTNNLEHYGICQLHFKHDDYADEKRMKLNADAIPSNFLTVTQNETEINFSISSPVEISTVCSKSPDESGSTLTGLCDSCTAVMKKNALLKKELGKKRRMISTKNAEIKRLRSAKKSRKESIKKLKLELEDLKKRLKDVFTDTQIRIFGGDFNEYVHWTEEDISKSISIYSISKRAYFHLQKRLKFPLPSESTLKRWLQKIDINPGELFPSVMNLLACEFAGLPSKERICALSIDEMDIDDRFCYDPKVDQVLGECKSSYVVSIRGIFNRWKQAIQYDWEKMLSSVDVVNIIKALYQVGIDVRAFVSDMGPKNQRLWRDLGLGIVKNGEINRTWFLHPVTQRKVYVFPDFPHLLKLLRNHTMDNGVYFPNGQKLEKQLFKDLLRKQKTEFCLTSKLSHKHLFLKGKQRQNVGTAFQLFDHTVAKAIRLLVPGNVTQANFIDLVHECAQITNVRTSIPNRDPSKSAYGMNLEEQNNILDCMFKTFQEITIGPRKKRTYAPFQKGILMYITSLKALYLDLKEELCVDYIIPARLNQDHLENFFSQLRGLGGFNSNPTALDFKYRMKRLVTSHTLLTPHSSSVSYENDDCEMLSSRLFSYLLSDETADIPVLKTRPAAVGLLSDENVDRLTSIDWNPDSRVVNFENCTYNERSELGGMEYVAGYVAQYLSSTQPQLSNISEDVSKFWVDFLNNGVCNGLTQPSDEWFSIFRKWEEIFVALHGEKKVLKSPGVVKQLRTILYSNFPHVPREVIEYYGKLRVLLRVKYLNKCLEDEKFQMQERRRLANLPQNDQNGDICMESESHVQATDVDGGLQELQILENDLIMIEELLANCSEMC